MDDNWIYPTKQNVPPDILDGEWEVEREEYDDLWVKSDFSDIGDVIQSLRTRHTRYRIRRPRSKAPSHEEIMGAKYWVGHGGVASMVVGYDPQSHPNNPYCVIMHESVWFVDREWFIGRESAVVPPEGEG